MARSPEEKQEQRSFFFWYKPEMRKALRKSMTRLGLGGIARRLLYEKRNTEDVTPPPHIAPWGMQVPDHIAKSGKPVITPKNPDSARLAAARKGAKKPMRATSAKPGHKPVPKAAPKPFQKFFKNKQR